MTVASRVGVGSLITGPALTFTYPGWGAREASCDTVAAKAPRVAMVRPTVRTLARRMRRRRQIFLGAGDGPGSQRKNCVGGEPHEVLGAVSDK